eukprot:m.286707 g.286707  ORF g.286707 m.286707 type:complete len:55 (-) comp11625_c0_seq1:66-230(-)
MPSMDQIVRAFTPIRELVIGFAISGYLFYSIPVSRETRENSTYCNPKAAHNEHH